MWNLALYPVGLRVSKNKELGRIFKNNRVKVARIRTALSYVTLIHIAWRMRQSCGQYLDFLRRKPRKEVQACVAVVLMENLLICFSPSLKVPDCRCFHCTFPSLLFCNHKIILTYTAKRIRKIFQRSMEIILHKVQVRKWHKGTWCGWDIQICERHRQMKYKRNPEILNIGVGADKSFARPTSRCRRTESIVSLEREVCSCAELQVFSCYRSWNEACQETSFFNNIETRTVIKFIFFPARQGTEGNSRHSEKRALGEHAPSYATVKNRAT
jgi:hypothetical protein